LIWNEEKERELERIFTHFSGLMKAHIYKHQVGKLGVEIDDVLQEARIKLWKLVQNEKIVTNYASYIRKIVDTSVIDFFRKFKREEGIYLHEKSRKIAERTPGYDTDFIYEEMDLKDLVGKAVESLIPSRRNVVRLYLLNMSIEEIALHFNWSPPKTRNLLYRGLNDLKKILVEKNIDYEHQP
jgi:RNA polymerase sigma factor (sigma-70 family)